MSEHDSSSDTGRFFAELRRRRVVRFSLAYAAAAFVVLQLAEIVFPAFGIGERGLRFLVVAVALGFIPAVVVAWIYDITKEGIRRTATGTGRPPPRTATLAALAITTIAVTAGVGWYGVSTDLVAPAESSSPSSPPMVAGPITSLAVLPLVDFSPEGGQEYFAAGMHDEIIAKLSLLEGVRVVSRTTSMGYADSPLTSPEIGRELGVDALIEGSVNRSGDQVRITLQLIDAERDAHLRTLQFDRGTDNLLALQSDVARAVALEIGAYGQEDFEVVASVPSAAQDAYLRGRHEYDRGTPDGYQRALDFFQEAVDSAPDYAEALAGVAGARFMVALQDPESRREELQRARVEVEAALALDSTSADVRDLYGVIGRAMYRMRRPDERRASPTGGAGRGLAGRAATATFDTAWVAAMTTLGQRIDEGVRANVLEGSGAVGRTTEARLLMAQGRFSDAVQVLQPLVAESPGNATAWDQLVRSHAALREPERAVAVVARWSSSGADGAPTSDDAARLRTAVTQDGMRGYWTWRRDYLEAAQSAGGDVSLTELAAAYAVLGERARAYELLAAALEDRESRVLAVPSDPVWDPLRRDPRFREIEQSIRRARFDMSLRILADTSDARVGPRD